MPDLVAQNCQLTLSAITLKTPFPRSMSVIGDISTTIRIKCSQLNIFLLRIAGSSTTKTVRDSSKTRKTDNADTHHHLNTGFRPRWRVLRPYPLGSGRRGRHCYLIRIKNLKVSQEISMPSGHTALALAADPRGGIWLGLVNGDLAHYRDGRFERSSLIMVGTLARSCALWLMPTGRCGAQPSKDFSAGRMGRCRP